MKHQVLHCTMDEFVQMHLSRHEKGCSPFLTTNERIDEIFEQGVAERINASYTLTHVEVHGDGVLPMSRITPCDADYKAKSVDTDQYSEAMAKARDEYAQ